MKLINPNLIKHVIDLNPVQAGATYFKESQKHDHLRGGKFSCKYLLILIFHQDPPLTHMSLQGVVK